MSLRSKSLLSFTYSSQVDILFDGNHTDAYLSVAVPSTSNPSSLLGPNAPSLLSPPGGPVYRLLAANDGYANWNLPPTVPIAFVHCRDDDVVPVDNAYAASAALGNAPIVYGQPVPFLSTAVGSIHAAAFLTATFAAFTLIEKMDKGY